MRDEIHMCRNVDLHLLAHRHLASSAVNMHALSANKPDFAMSSFFTLLAYNILRSPLIKARGQPEMRNPRYLSLFPSDLFAHYLDPIVAWTRNPQIGCVTEFSSAYCFVRTSLIALVRIRTQKMPTIGRRQKCDPRAGHNDRPWR